MNHNIHKFRRRGTQAEERKKTLKKTNLNKTFHLGFEFEKNVMVCFSNVYVQNKMAINEEDLSISVQKYTVLFDNGHKEFHRKDVKKDLLLKKIRTCECSFTCVFFRRK